MKKTILTSILICMMCVYAAPLSLFAETDVNTEGSEEAPQEELSDEAKAYFKWAGELWNSLDRKTGLIELPNKVATLDVPEGFYYLGPDDAQKVLVEVWKNPPGKKTLGMIFPEKYTPFESEAWAFTVTYSEDGYVSDEDADDIDYNELLEDMQSGTREESKQRVEQGYGSIELIGWAEQPYYDSQAKKLYWAQELRFDNDPESTLNYNIRILGRKGVLVLNFIAGINQLDEIKQNKDTALAMASFNDGFKYSDFNPEIDKVAAYGIGGLIAGKVLAKAGFFKVALIFFKKAGIFIFIGIGVLIKRLFGRKEGTESA